MSDEIRYSRNTDLIEIILAMIARPEGITLKYIQDEFLVSRRTAERMRDSLLNSSLGVEELDIEDDNNAKHWGFSSFSTLPNVIFTPKEIVNIEQYQRRTTNKEVKHELNATIDKMKIISKKKV